MTTSSVSLTVPPDWDEIDDVREQALAFFAERGLDHDTAMAMSMATCELTENAVKYGEFAPSEHVEVELTREPSIAMVEVRSRIPEADLAHLPRLDAMIQWIRGFQDPFEAYVERLKVVSGQRLEHRESGLGLVRIAYEGQATLDFFVDEHRVVSVSAVREVE